MWKKIAVGTAAVLAVGGAGTAVAATTGGTSSGGGMLTASGSSTSGSTTPGHQKGSHKGHHKGRREALGALRRVAHGQVVVKGKGSTYVTVDVVRGAVTGVSGTSITVKAADGFSQTYTVGKDTKVLKAAARPTSGSSGTKRQKPSSTTISTVKTGQQVFVEGTGKGPYVAKRVLELAS